MQRSRRSDLDFGSKKNGGPAPLLGLRTGVKTLPEDIAFVLDQKRKYFWNQRSITKADTSYVAHRAIKSLSTKSRQGKVLLYFDKYCTQIGALIDEAVPVFVEVISRVEGMSLADRTATVRQNVEDCIISASKTRSSIVRWLVDACEHHPSLEFLRALYEDPNIWIAPRWLTPPRTRVESKNGIWFFVAGSKRAGRPCPSRSVLPKPGYWT